MYVYNSVWGLFRFRKVIFVGDATMGPYEITYPGGSVEHWNEKPDSDYMNRLTRHFSKIAWLNPQPEAQ